MLNPNGEKLRRYEEMILRRENSKEEVTLSVQGPLDSDTAEQFQKQLNELAAGEYRVLTLDLSEVPSINSTCIGKILLLRKSLTEQDRLIRIKGCSDAVYNTLQLIKFDKLINVSR
jgi:anti-anti-sigma factor